MDTSDKNILAVVGVAGAAVAAAVLGLFGAALTMLITKWRLKFTPPFYMCYKISFRAFFYLAALSYITFFVLIEIANMESITNGTIIFSSLGCGCVIETYVTAKFMQKPDGVLVGWKNAAQLVGIKTLVIMLLVFILLML